MFAEVRSNNNFEFCGRRIGNIGLTLYWVSYFRQGVFFSRVLCSKCTDLKYFHYCVLTLQYFTKFTIEMEQQKCYASGLHHPVCCWTGGFRTFAVSWFSLPKLRHLLECNGMNGLKVPPAMEGETSATTNTARKISENRKWNCNLMVIRVTKPGANSRTWQSEVVPKFLF